MRTNPFSDVLGFLTQAGWTTYVFWLLIIASVVIAAVNLRRAPGQRSVLHLWNWLARFFIGALCNMMKTGKITSDQVRVFYTTPAFFVSVEEHRSSGRP